MIILVAYDIPATKTKTSHRLRRTLHRLGYTMLQKSLYIAHGDQRLAATTWTNLKPVATEAGARLLMVKTSLEDIKAINPATPLGRAWMLYAA